VYYYINTIIHLSCFVKAHIDRVAPPQYNLAVLNGDLLSSGFEKLVSRLIDNMPDEAFVQEDKTMKFIEFGDNNRPTIILLHGGGLSRWSVEPLARQLQNRYHIVTPVVDGHGEDGGTPFISIEDSAGKLIGYIDRQLGGAVYAIGGLSLGAQITAEVLAQRPDIAEFAVLESGLMVPIRGTSALVAPSFKLFYGLIRKRWFSKAQAKSMRLPQEMFELYYEDTKKMTKESLVNMTLSNGTYALKDSIRNTTARVLIIVGSKELGIMKKSAALLHRSIQSSTLRIAQDMKHGELSLIRPDIYVRLLEELFEGKEKPA
jgi:pimeloyl-ACP methyl ester carboxylesterase